MSYKHFFHLLRFIFLYDNHSYSFYFRRENVSKKKKKSKNVILKVVVSTSGSQPWLYISLKTY